MNGFHNISFYRIQAINQIDSGAYVLKRDGLEFKLDLDKHMHEHSRYVKSLIVFSIHLAFFEIESEILDTLKFHFALSFHQT